MSAEIATVNPPDKLAIGAYEGASRTSRELASHRPAVRSADAEILRDKTLLDARGKDLVRNDGYSTGAVSIHKDSIVGHQFRLNARPAHRVLGLDEKWADEFQQYCEERFTLYAESEDRWVDASRRKTLTDMVRMAVGGVVTTGEVLASVEWLRSPLRPYKTAIQMIDPDRLCNPDGQSDTENLRGGIERGFYGEPLAGHIRNGYANDPWAKSAYVWKRVPFYKPWGRVQLIHIYEQMRPDQTRGVAEMVSVLKQMRMTSRFNDITLQNAVVNATYAATIESELPREVALSSIGADPNTMDAAISYVKAVGAWDEAANIAIDGVKIPHLFPGSKLQMRPAGTVGGIGDNFEISLLRHIAAGLGLSYEQFSRDYSKVNYSSARASMNETWKYMQSRKKAVADRFANYVYALWLEEEMNRPNSEIWAVMPKKAPSFYEPLMKDAYVKCAWIGASRGQVDELKETQAASMRMANGTGTLEEECAKLGKDWREVLQQKAREQKLASELGVTLSTDAMTPGANDAKNAMQDAGNSGTNNSKTQQAVAALRAAIEETLGVEIDT